MCICIFQKCSMQRKQGQRVVKEGNDRGCNSFYPAVFYFLPLIFSMP